MTQKRSIPCLCTKTVKVNEVKRDVLTQEGFFGWLAVGVHKVLEVTKKLGLKSNKIPAYEIIESTGEKCSLCNGKRVIEDPTDCLEEEQKRIEAIKSKKKQILECERKSAQAGGNKISVVVGNFFQKVGLEFNDSPSYEVKKESVPRQSGLTIKPMGVAPIYSKGAQVVGKMPLTTIGGNYFLNVANKLRALVGAQGIDIQTKGPLTVGAGITKILSPEVTIGSRMGVVSLEGETITISGKHIMLTPDPSGRGQVSVQGTLAINGNLITQGGAHIEGDLSFISATAPMKVDRTRFSSDPNQFTGAAQWSSNALQTALQDFIRKWSIYALDPSMYFFSPRGITAYVTDVLNLAKKALPVEPVQTGFAIMGNTILPVYNYPHHHVLFDGAHCHDMFVPNINLVNSSDEVRQLSMIKETIAPVPAAKQKESLIGKIFDSIRTFLALYPSKV